MQLIKFIYCKTILLYDILLNQNMKKIIIFISIKVFPRTPHIAQLYSVHIRYTDTVRYLFNYIPKSNNNR